MLNQYLNNPIPIAIESFETTDAFIQLPTARSNLDDASVSRFGLLHQFVTGNEMRSHDSYTDEVVNLRNVGLTTPVRIGSFKYISTSETNSSTAKISLLIAHGLGAGNPKSKTHLLDSWVDLIGEGVLISKRDASFISYTARGHGDSHGWECTASNDLDQFTWRRLSADMIAISDYYTLDSFIASGSSMGSGERGAVHCYEEMR